MSHYEIADSSEWAVPYLPIDPNDVGRTYESIIRINSQSGKGGVAYIMDHEFGIKLPKEMHPDFGAVIQQVTDQEGRELKPEEIYQEFERTYINIHAPYDLHSFHVMKRHSDKQERRSFAEVEATVEVEGVEREIRASGNGPLDAFSTALKAQITGNWTLRSYHEHAINTGSHAKAIAYIEIERADGRRYWGAGIDTDIIIASVKALLSGLNRSAG
jgi:2-isopropylmalate synthase